MIMNMFRLRPSLLRPNQPCLLLARRRYLSAKPPPPPHPEPTTFSAKPKNRPSAVTDSLGSVGGGMKSGFGSSSYADNANTSLSQINPNAKPEVMTFSDTSRPGSRTSRELPKIPKTWPKVLLGLAISLPLWGAFLFTVWNQEKLSSSIFLQIMRTLRASGTIQEALGDAIRVEPVWWLNGEGIVWGEISHPAGSIDLSFRVKGTKSSGTVYFTSVRKQKGAPWTLLRFRLITDDGRIVNVDPYDGFIPGSANVSAEQPVVKFDEVVVKESATEPQARLV